MQCTTCQSDNVQKLSLVYEQGTQNIRTSSHTTGGGVGFGRGGLGVGGGSATTTTTGRSQSIAAQRAAPPDKKKIGIPFTIAGAGLAIALIWGAIPIFLIALAVGGFLFWKFSQYNKNVYPPLYAEWQRSWLCNKCGTIYQQ